MAPVTTEKTLRSQSCAFRNTGGVSSENRSLGFKPAFRDRETGTVYLSRTKEGAPATIHQFDGLPKELVSIWTGEGKPRAIKATVEPGFVRDGYFYTREQAAKAVFQERGKADV